MSRRMRVVHVTGCLDMGGLEKLLVEFARHADRDRFDLHFVSLEGRGLLAEELEAQGWPVTALGLGAGVYPRLPWRLARLFGELQADVVHTHNDRPLLYAAPAARWARTSRILHTKHGRGAGNSRRQNFLVSLAARLTHRFVCVSADCARLAAEQGVPAGCLAVIRNGIDLQAFAGRGPQAHGPAVIVARLCPDKDVATLLDAVAIVIRATPGFRLWIAGDGPCRADLQQLAERLGLASHVRFLGLVRDVPALLAQAGMYVLSSVTEGVSLTLLEAMAAGLPIAATRVGGTAEAVENGLTGLLVPPRDPAALAAALVQLQRDPASGCAMGQAGRARAVADFDIRKMVAKYEHLYAEAPGGVSKSARRMEPCASHI